MTRNSQSVMFALSSSGKTPGSSFRVGLLGLGLAGNAHWHQAMLQPALKVIAACRRDPQELDDYCEHRGIEGRYTDAHELLANAGLEAIVISTPHDTLAFHVAAALRARCRVILAEKPLATSRSDLEQIRLARVSSLGELIVAYPRRYLNHYRQVSEWVRTGEIGKVRNIACEWPGSYDSWYSEERASPKTFRTDPARAVRGVLLDAGSHLIDTVLWLSNESITEISALAEWLPSGIEISVVLAGRLGNSALITASIFPTQLQSTRRTTIFGTCGRIEVDDRRAVLTTNSGQSTIAHEPGPENAIWDMVQVLRGSPITGCTFEQAARVIAVIEAGYTAAESGRLVTVSEE